MNDSTFYGSIAFVMYCLIKKADVDKTIVLNDSSEKILYYKGSIDRITKEYTVWDYARNSTIIGNRSQLYDNKTKSIVMLKIQGQTFRGVSQGMLFKGMIFEGKVSVELSNITYTYECKPFRLHKSHTTRFGNRLYELEYLRLKGSAS